MKYYVSHAKIVAGGQFWLQKKEIGALLSHFYFVGAFNLV
jgi:hypothetical protein